MKRCVVGLLFALFCGWNTAVWADVQMQHIGQFKEPPKIDGVLDEWDGLAQLPMSQPNVEDLRVDKAYVAWDEKHIYLAVSLHDKALVNENPIENLQLGDCLDFRMARTMRDTQMTRLCIAPTTSLKKPAMKLVLPDKTMITDTTGSTEIGVKWAVKIDGDVWSIEAAIPADIPDVKLQQTASFPFVFVVWDRDQTETNDWNPWWRRSEFGNQKKPISTWPMMILMEHASAGQVQTVAPKSTAKPIVTQEVVKESQDIPATSDIKIDISQRVPCNLFEPGEKVIFTAYPKSAKQGKGQLQAKVTDYFGKTVNEQVFALSLPDESNVEMTFENVPRGYFELQLDATLTDETGQKQQGSQKISFAVADFTHRSASEVRQGGYRFGMKMFYLDTAWWQGNAKWDERQVVDAMCKLGMQWTRVMLQQEAHLSTESMVKDFPMNAIFKVERFPREFYEEARYGPLKEYEARYGRGSWVLKTLPRKEPYQAWLKTELAKLPPEQNVFEIWNEAWDKMSAEDLAKLSNWIVDAILAERPDAIIGPNLLGSTSKYEYDARFINAGGMKGMKMVALHPYASSENRLWLREYRKWISDRVGYPVDIYVTEYGSHSTPQGPAKRSEQVQAQRVVRQSLALYAEDVKAFTPHWIGQREHNPTYHEDWYGFIRLNHQPKPALVAHAVSGRMIDASRYVGDLFFDHAVDAMLFERDGIYTLAIWTQEGQKQITVHPGVENMTLVDMVGKRTEIHVNDNRLELTASPDLIYLVGVSPKLADKATTAIDPLRWARQDTPVHLIRDLPKATHRIVPDGKIDEWDDALQLYMHNPKVNGDDASGTAYISWDQNHLYIALAMRDNEILNERSLNKIYQQDSMELFISTEPRDNNPGYGPNDFQFMVTPVSRFDKPLFVKITQREAGKSAPVSGGIFYAGKSDTGWVTELAIPWSELSGFIPQKGGKIAMELRVNDADTSHERWKIDAENVVVRPGDPTLWSHFIFK